MSDFNPPTAVDTLLARLTSLAVDLAHYIPRIDPKASDTDKLAAMAMLTYGLRRTLRAMEDEIMALEERKDNQ